MGLHGDGVQYTTSMRAGGAKSIIVVSFNYIAGPPRIRGRRFMYCVLRKAAMCDCGCEGWHTLQDVMAVFAWSFQHLARAPILPTSAEGCVAVVNVIVVCVRPTESRVPLTQRRQGNGDHARPKT